MDYQIFLTYIVLALIVAITIHILFKIFYKNNSNKMNMEKMDTMEKKLSGSVDSDKSTYRQYDSLSQCSGSSSSLSNKNRIPNNIMSDNESYETDDVIGISNKTPNLVNCTSCEINNTYTKEFLMDWNDVQCPTQEVEYSREQLQDYRDDFFGFRSHLWQKSDTIDPVDRMNERLYDGNGDIAGSNTKTISDIYDSLTAEPMADRGKRPKQPYVMTQNLDNISMSPQYKMPATLGDYYTNDNWMYNRDHVMNGALFYDGVSGVDPMMNDQMAVS